jgi:lipopolysaccharide export system permease protein
VGRIVLTRSEIQNIDPAADVKLINNDILEIPMPPDSQIRTDEKLQEISNAEIVTELIKNRNLIATVRKRESIKAGFAFASGRVESINWTDVNTAFREQADWTRRCNELETEWHLRISMGIGSLLFVFLGAPVGILFAKRDFLSAFMTCFLPIIGLYYPLMLFGTNLSKEGLLAPYYSLWIGNGLLALLAGLVLPSVVKH